jgi:superfamily II DNA helicase RecQ
MIAGTGMGKTLTFWMPLCFFPAGHIQVVVTPFNLLGRQNVELLEKAGMMAIFIGADMATSEDFLVSQPLQILKDN